MKKKTVMQISKASAMVMLVVVMVVVVAKEAGSRNKLRVWQRRGSGNDLVVVVVDNCEWKW